MVKTKRKNVLIGLSILVMLMCFVVGLFMLQTYTVYAAEDTESLEESALQFDVTEYEGEKINATYAFSQINDKECSVRITNKSVATTAVIPSRSGSDIKGFIITKGQTNLTDLDVLDPNIFISDDIVIPKEATLGGFKYPIII